MASRVFEEAAMIITEPDGTIIICNWGKYQSVEGMEKIRNQAAVRHRKALENKALEQLMLTAPAAKSHVTDNVTSRDSHVTGHGDSNVTSRDSHAPRVQSTEKESTEADRRRRFVYVQHSTDEDRAATVAAAKVAICKDYLSRA